MNRNRGLIVDRRGWPHSGPRERRGPHDRREHDVPVAVERRARGERRASDRSRGELWDTRAAR